MKNITNYSNRNENNRQSKIKSKFRYNYNSSLEIDTLPAIKNNSRNNIKSIDTQQVEFRPFNISKELIQLANNNREYISSSWRSHLNRVHKYKKIMKVLKHNTN